MKTLAASLLCAVLTLCALAPTPTALAATAPSPLSVLTIGGHPTSPDGGPLHVHIQGLTLGNLPYITVVGLSAINVPFGNTILVPALDLILTGTCDGNGADTYSVFLPDNLPIGMHIYVQCWQKVSQEIDVPPGTWEGGSRSPVQTPPVNLARWICTIRLNGKEAATSHQRVQCSS